ncbi:MAG: hypothetical protein NXI23_09990 [Bacteroidetes bacterium]|jgi:tetratricopeptide (TPR) repeat protein|nr:hypothetical protein [Bacteroidota bacterium]MDF1866223.1 hypothetical protein [Saprospiraceae bacterium]
MTKLQLGVVISAIALFLVLYIGCDTKPNNYEEVAKRRVLSAESTNVNSLLVSAKKTLKPSQLNVILALEQQLEEVSIDSVKNETLKSLSGKWYETGRSDISGHYALQIAELENSENAWSIAGTTFSICIQRTAEEKIKSYCTDKAIQSFENAISINPENPQHQLNLSLIYAENPPQDNPMKGILMLLDLNKKFPENVGVLVNLGRLGLKTAQFEKAAQRLEKVIVLEPDNRSANCLLIEAYEGLGQKEKVLFYQNKCEALSE